MEYQPPKDILTPPGWSSGLAVDCEHLAYVLAIAYLNQGEIVFVLNFNA